MTPEELEKLSIVELKALQRDVMIARDRAVSDINVLDQYIVQKSQLAQQAIKEAKPKVNTTPNKKEQV